MHSSSVQSRAVPSSPLAEIATIGSLSGPHSDRTRGMNSRTGFIPSGPACAAECGTAESERRSVPRGRETRLQKPAAATCGGHQQERAPLPRAHHQTDDQEVRERRRRAHHEVEGGCGVLGSLHAVAQRLQNAPDSLLVAAVVVDGEDERAPRDILSRVATGRQSRRRVSGAGVCGCLELARCCGPAPSSPNSETHEMRWFAPSEAVYGCHSRY